MTPLPLLLPYLRSLLSAFRNRTAQVVRGSSSAGAGEGKMSYLKKAMNLRLLVSCAADVKSEYYVQGGETKRMFRVMGLQAGDGLKLTVTGKHSSIPTVRLTVIPAGGVGGRLGWGGVGTRHRHSVV